MHASVIIVSYNSRAYLGPCIESILAAFGPQDEIIVVDNGSTDGSAGFVQAHYPQVQLIRGRNTGYGVGNNRGAAVARGEYLVFLNPDTVIHPGALAGLLAPLERETGIALTTACIVYMHQPETINTCGNTMHYTGLTYCRGAGRPRTEYATSAEVGAVSGAAFAIRRAVFEELGGFDALFFMYVEDTDLSWRAQLAGYRCLYVAEAVVEHDYRRLYSPRKAFYLDRNRHIMLLKNLSRPTYLRMLPGLLLAELLTWGFLMLRGPGYWAVKLRVYHWLWQHRGMIKAARLDAQMRRRRLDHEVLSRMTDCLEFEQLADRRLAFVTALVFHPAFRMARLLFAGGRT
jgi:GT2 family glycosyltransferase